MKSLNLGHNESKSQTAVFRIKTTYGILYGLIAGIAFAVASWGWDGYLLKQAHAAYPWLKFSIGVVLCGLAGAIAGWITIRFERWFFTLLAWLGVTALFSWLIVTLPLQVTSILTTRLEPQLQGFIHYTPMGEMIPRFWLAFMWILIFAILAGILQTPFIDSAVFSVSIFGKLMPFLLGTIILASSGTIADGLNNEPLRRAVMAMDYSIQFVIDHQGTQVDPTLARANFAGSLNGIREHITPARKLIVSEYDSLLGEIRVVVIFDDFLANCIILYAQPSYCTPLQNEP